MILLVSGGTVYWITAPGTDADTRIVKSENVADPSVPEAASGWQVVDFAASVRQHPDWWNDVRPSAAGLTGLAQTLDSRLGARTAAVTPSFPLNPVGLNPTA